MEIVEDDGAWTASVPDLPGCNSYGATINEAVENVQRTKDLWIQGQYEADADIPEPTDEEDYSGRFVLRIPKVLHRSLAHEARVQGVSLNHYASHLLSQRQPLNAFHNFARSILAAGSNAWRTPWMFCQNEPGSTVMMGKLPGNLEFLAYVSKPPAKATMKLSVPAGARRQYLPK